MESLLKKIKVKYEGELDVEVVDDSLCFKHPLTDIEITLSKDTLDECGSEEEAVNKILNILGLNYISGDCLFDETYFEARACKIICVNGRNRLQTHTTGETDGHNRRTA
jgi:hypothetical protein